MSITQARLLTVIQAGEEYRKVYNWMKGCISDEITAIRAMPPTAAPSPREVALERALSNVALRAQHNPDQYHADKILDLERVRYNLTHKKNTWIARRKAAKRAFQVFAEPSPKASGHLSVTRATVMPERSAREIAAEVDAEDDGQVFPEAPGAPNPFGGPIDYSRPDPITARIAYRKAGLTEAEINAKLAPYGIGPDE